mgnify:CR=1 FL=1
MLKVILVGDHPEATTGNSHMMTGIANQLSSAPDDFQLMIYAINPRTTIRGEEAFSPPKWNVIDMHSPQRPNIWMPPLIQLVSGEPIDAIVFVGLDVWTFAPILKPLQELKRHRSFIVGSIFPYEFINVRSEWIEWLNMIDLPLVYSKYGYNMLKEQVRHVQYFRPPLYDAEQFVPLSKTERTAIKQRLFSNFVNDSHFIFGFVGHNQIRKDPQRAIKAFFEVKKRVPNVKLYLHTETTEGEFNLIQYIKEFGGEFADIFIKKQNYQYSTKGMVEVYNSIDCLLNTSLQEGLSWTLLEAMLCKTPVLASYNTAQMELLDDGAGIGVPCEEIAYLPIIINPEEGVASIESRACSFYSLVNAMEKIVKNKELREETAEKGCQRAQEWVAGVDNLCGPLLLATRYNKAASIIIKKEGVLFAQHSAAGDVLMTTKALPGVRKMYNGLPLTYMTSIQYMDILINNPYVDRIIPWNAKELQRYEHVLNPHGDIISPGHWGRNSNSLLSDFYWKILKVEKSPFYIEQLRPRPEIAELIEDSEYPICILHTTGGDPAFRTYKYMCDVEKAISSQYLTIQIGGANDFPANAQIDLRGMLSYREAAWVVARATIAVTVDSFISHLCGALGISQICLFGSGNVNVVKPDQVKGKLITMSPDYINDCKGLGPCSATVRDCPLPCTSIHNPTLIIQNIKLLEESL